MSKPAELEVVIASYSEPLDWIGLLPKGNGIKHTIYRATNGLFEPKPSTIGPKKIPVIQIPNGGREAGQYLWHIIHNWNDLAKITVFLQGDAPKHATSKTLETLTPPRFWDDPRQMAYLNISKDHDTRWPHPLGDMHRKIHDIPWNGEPPQAGMFAVGAHVWATKKVIKANKKAHYEAYYRLRNEPHYAHLLEGTWHTVFGVYR